MLWDPYLVRLLYSKMCKNQDIITALFTIFSKMTAIQTMITILSLWLMYFWYHAYSKHKESELQKHNMDLIHKASEK